MSLEYISKNRVNLVGQLTEKELLELSADESISTIQFCVNPNEFDWKSLDNQVFQKRSDLSLRVYGLREVDLSFLKQLPSLSRFYMNCTQGVCGYQYLECLKHIKELHISDEELTSFEILNVVSEDLEILGIGKTQSKKPSLRPLKRFKHLNTLTLVNQQKDLDVMQNLSHLKELRLISFTSPNLTFFNHLKSVKSLTYLLGGADDLSPIAALINLEVLELDWIRRLSDLSFLENCSNLTSLKLSKLKQVTELPKLSKIKKLKKLSISDLNGLTTVEEIANITSLEQLSGGHCGLSPAIFSKALSAPRLKEAYIYFPSTKKEKEFDDEANSLGIKTDIYA